MKKPHVWMVVMVALSIGAQSEASITALGDLPGGRFYSHAWGVSADGSVVVGHAESARGFEAFRWTSDEGMVGRGGVEPSRRGFRPRALPTELPSDSGSNRDVVHASVIRHPSIQTEVA